MLRRQKKDQIGLLFSFQPCNIKKTRGERLKLCCDKNEDLSKCAYVTLLTNWPKALADSQDAITHIEYYGLVNKGRQNITGLFYQ